MTITYKVYDFPTFPVEKQIFYVPGLAFSGGFTTGGIRISSPSPGGFGFLDIQPALQIREWDYPLSSWLMSKTNGEILRVRLAPTPQICNGLQLRTSNILWDTDLLWSNFQPWANDLTAMFSANALEGSTSVQIDMSNLGQLLQVGHVIGHQFSTYIIDEITYDAYDSATVVVKPPLRRDIADGDFVNFRPFFTGSIANPVDIIKTYDAGDNGNIQMPEIVLQEVIIP